LVDLNSYIYLSLILFFIGFFGFVFRRNLIILLACVEIMLNALIILFASISYFRKDATGYILVFFIIAMAAAEAAVGLTLAVALYKKLKKVYTEEINLFRG